MAAYSVALAKSATLVADVADTVTLTRAAHTVVVYNRGTAPIWAKPSFAGASAATPAGDECFYVEAGESKEFESGSVIGSVQVVAATAEPYTVEAF